MRRNFSILISAISIILLTICSFGFAGSQTGTLPTDEYQQYKIQNIKNATSNTTSPEEARKWFIDQRKSMTGNIPDNWREDAMENIRKFNIRPDGIEGVNELQWQEVGPTTSAEGCFHYLFTDKSFYNLYWHGLFRYPENHQRRLFLVRFVRRCNQ